MSTKPPDAFWFLGPVQTHHAFAVLEDGKIDDETCCGQFRLDEMKGDEPAREKSEFDDAPACVPCLAVTELEVPKVA